MSEIELKTKYAAAISLLAEWCHAIHTKGTSWDDWDEHYKNASYRPGILREDIDLEIAKIEAAENDLKNEYLKYLWKS